MEINFLKKGGTATTDQGLKIKAEEFEYDKLLNILIVTGNIKFDDEVNKIKYTLIKLHI